MCNLNGQYRPISHNIILRNPSDTGQKELSEAVLYDLDDWTILTLDLKTLNADDCACMESACCKVCCTI